MILAKRKMSVTELADRVGITITNNSILKNGKAKALKISTLAKLVTVLFYWDADKDHTITCVFVGWRP